MRKKINVLLALLLAVIMVFNYSFAIYADTSSGVSEEISENTSDDSELDGTAVQVTSINSNSEQISVQSTSDTNAAEENAAQSTTDTGETEETTVQGTSESNEADTSSVQSTSEDNESEEASEQSTTDDTESEEPSIQLFSYNGNTDISNPAVDSITISNTKEDGSVDAYNKFTATVSFSEDNKEGLDIQSGDTISVRWTAPEGATFTSYKGTVDLYQDGDPSKTKLGTANVTETGVTITFNDNVTNLQQVKGSVTFAIYVGHNPSSTNGGNGTITSGNVTTEVKVNYVNTDIGFGAKGGTYYTNGENKIDWQLWINGEGKSDLTDNTNITITDKLPDTETFDSFKELSFQTGESSWWAVYNLNDFNQNGRSFVYDESTNTITVTIPASLINGYVAQLHFITTSTAAAGDIVNNTANYTYYENGSSTPKKEEHTGSVTVPSSSGTVSGVPKGTIKITKVVNGTTDPIANIYFRVYKVVSESDTTRVSGWYNGADYAEIVTGADGVATIANLEDGYYEIAEVTDNLPNWIATSDIQSVYVALGGTAGTATTIPNSVKTGEITATKKWTQADGTTADISDHPTIYFRLYRNGSALTDDDLTDNQTAIQAVVTASGENTATVSWKNLPLYDNSGNAYTYTVKEVDADGNAYTPDGYTQSTSDDGLTITNSKDITYSDITATKKWVQNDGTTADTSDHPTIYFRLYRNGTALTDDDLTGDQTAIQKVVTESGESTATAIWNDLPDTDSAGSAYTYTVKEVDADGKEYTPEGYKKKENGLTVTNISDYQSISSQSSTKANTTKTTSTAVQTGDTQNITLWIALLLLALAAASVLMVKKIKETVK